MVKLRQLLFRKSNSAQETTLKKNIAQEALKKIKNGEDFSNLVYEYSEDRESKEKGGDLGYVSYGMMMEELANAVYPLKPGEVSEVIETSIEFHIIKVEDKKESSVESFDSAKKKIKDQLFNDAKNVQINDFLQKVIKDAGVELNYNLLQ